MKRGILSAGLFILSIIIIAGFFVLTPTYVSTSGNVKHFEDADISFDFNSSWSVYEYEDALRTPFLTSRPSSILLNPGDNSQYNYYNSSAGSTSNGVVNTSTTDAYDVVIVKTEIDCFDSLPEGVTLETAYQANSLYGLMAGTGGFTMSSNTTIDVNGNTAHQFIYDVSYIRYQDTWFESNGHYYRILSQAPSTFYTTAEPSFNTTVQSFHIK